MKQKRAVLLTVPHSGCSNRLIFRHCDEVARQAVNCLNAEFQDKNFPTIVHINNRYLRENCDLNRKWCDSHPWRKQLTKILSKNHKNIDLHLDVHSFPNERRKFEYNHPLYIIVDSGSRSVGNDLMKYLRKTVPRTRQLPFTGHIKIGTNNDIMEEVIYDWKIWASILLEFNETIALWKLKEICRLIVKWAGVYKLKGVPTNIPTNGNAKNMKKIKLLRQMIRVFVYEPTPGYKIQILKIYEVKNKEIWVLSKVTKPNFPHGLILVRGQVTIEDEVQINVQKHKLVRHFIVGPALYKSYGAELHYERTAKTYLQNESEFNQLIGIDEICLKELSFDLDTHDPKIRMNKIIYKGLEIIYHGRGFAHGYVGGGVQVFQSFSIKHLKKGSTINIDFYEDVSIRKHWKFEGYRFYYLQHKSSYTQNACLGVEPISLKLVQPIPSKKKKDGILRQSNGVPTNIPTNGNAEKALIRMMKVSVNVPTSGWRIKILKIYEVKNKELWILSNLIKLKEGALQVYSTVSDEVEILDWNFDVLNYKVKYFILGKKFQFYKNEPLNKKFQHLQNESSLNQLLEIDEICLKEPILFPDRIRHSIKYKGLEITYGGRGYIDYVGGGADVFQSFHIKHLKEGTTKTIEFGKEAVSMRKFKGKRWFISEWVFKGFRFQYLPYKSSFTENACLRIQPSSLKLAYPIPFKKKKDGILRQLSVGSKNINTNGNNKGEKTLLRTIRVTVNVPTSGFKIKILKINAVKNKEELWVLSKLIEPDGLVMEVLSTVTDKVEFFNWDFDEYKVKYFILGEKFQFYKNEPLNIKFKHLSNEAVFHQLIGIDEICLKGKKKKIYKGLTFQYRQPRYRTNDLGGIDKVPEILTDDSTTYRSLIMRQETFNEYRITLKDEYSDRICLKIEPSGITPIYELKRVINVHVRTHIPGYKIEIIKVYEQMKTKEIWVLSKVSFVHRSLIKRIDDISDEVQVALRYSKGKKFPVRHFILGHPMEEDSKVTYLENLEQFNKLIGLDKLCISLDETKPYKELKIKFWAFAMEHSGDGLSGRIVNISVIQRDGSHIGGGGFIENEINRIGPYYFKYTPILPRTPERRICFRIQPISLKLIYARLNPQVNLSSTPTPQCTGCGIHHQVKWGCPTCFEPFCNQSCFQLNWNQHKETHHSF